MNNARIFSKLSIPISLEQLENIITQMALGVVHDLGVCIYGFTYEPGKGIWTFGPREEIEKIAGEGRYIEDFDLDKYVKETSDEIFWFISYEDPLDPKLMRMKK